MREVGAAWAVFDVPVLQPLLKHTTHHLWSAISCEVFRNIPRCTEVPQDGHQVLAIELARRGGDDGVPTTEPVGYHEEVVAMKGELVGNQHMEGIICARRSHWETSWL